jgi:hypothetical protein
LTISFQPVSFAYGDGIIAVSLSDVEILDKFSDSWWTPVYATVSYEESGGTVVPEPSSVLLLGFATLGITIVRRMK